MYLNRNRDYRRRRSRPSRSRLTSKIREYPSEVDSLGSKFEREFRERERKDRRRRRRRRQLDALRNILGALRGSIAIDSLPASRRLALTRAVEGRG